VAVVSTKEELETSKRFGGRQGNTSAGNVVFDVKFTSDRTVCCSGAIRVTFHVEE
jgi:hypothetical protein